MNSEATCLASGPAAAQHNNSIQTGKMGNDNLRTQQTVCVVVTRSDDIIRAIKFIRVNYELKLCLYLG